MKRRHFLAASALLPLFASTEVIAAKKNSRPKATAKKSPAKPATGSQDKAASSGKENPAASPEPRNVVSLPDEPPAQWRTYDITSTLSLSAIDGQTRLWIPLAQYKDSPWQRSLGHRWQGNFDSAGIYRDPVADMEVFYADWDDNTSQPQLHLISQVATQDRHFDITRRSNTGERTEILRRCLQSTEQLPIDGLVRRTAERAIGRVKDPLAQGKAIYDWVVENSDFDAQRSGVGSGEISKLLESGRPSGKSADLALLFVALCRSIGIPARPVFGLRIDNSRLFGSLGSSGEHQNNPHCRAEFYIPGYGWVPVDPSDVRKAIVTENLGLSDSRLTVLKKLLFGFWEMNWIGFNTAQDVDLRGARLGKSLPFLVLPHAETGSKHFNSLDSSLMSYRVKASRVDL